MAKKDTTAVIEQEPIQETPKQTGLVKNGDKYSYIVKRKAVRTQTRRRTVLLVLIILALIATLVLGAIYGVLSFIDYNSFRITVDRSSGEYLALSDNFDFTNPSNMLALAGPRYMDNITYAQLEQMKFLNEDGNLNGINYIANAFYLSNMGNTSLSYKEIINITNVYKGLDSAIRIMLIKQVSVKNAMGEYVMQDDAEYRVFAKSFEGTNPIDERNLDRIPGEPEYVTYIDNNVQQQEPNPNIDSDDYGQPWLCENFANEKTGSVLNSEFSPLLPGQKIRYVIVVWIEGSDPECVNAVLQGKITLTAQFVTSSAA